MITFDPQSSFPTGKNWGNPQVGQYYCNNTPSQGNSCILIIGPNDPIYNNPNHPPYPAINQLWIPGVPTKISIGLVPPSWGPFYNTQQNCESDCSNHYVFNCWNWNNGNSSPNVSFPNITTAQKNHFCDVCQYDLAGSLIKSHPYCWCLDNGTGLHINPPASVYSLAPYVYTCPPHPNPCPNGMVTLSDPNWGHCHECIGMQPTPSPWPTITGPNCECCDDTPIAPPTWDCCTYATCPGTFQLHYGPAWQAANPGSPTPSVNPDSRFCQERSDGTGQYYTFPACNEKCKHTPLPYHIRR